MKSLMLLHLSLIKGVGSQSIQNLIPYLNNIYDFDKIDFIEKSKIPSHLSNKIFCGLKNKALLNKELELIDKYNIKFFSFLDDYYPKLLKNIYYPPVIIYYKGQPLADYKDNLAVVGSRKATAYSYKIINSIFPDLILRGFNIVSGGAIGVDTIAHSEAIKHGGKTIVVLGSGLLKPYPKCNMDLFNKVLDKNGTIISSFGLLDEAFPGNFPARNRIISGLSRGCLVVQAAKKSGALITAKFALDQGREVFAIPGNINEELSEGCNSLIKQGAKLVTNSNDILQELIYY